MYDIIIQFLQHWRVLTFYTHKHFVDSFYKRVFLKIFIGSSVNNGVKLFKKARVSVGEIEAYRAVPRMPREMQLESGDPYFLNAR